MIVDRGMNKEYAAIGGEASFGKLSAQLAFGDAAGIVADGRNVTVQAISGTGSLRCLATQFSHFCQLHAAGRAQAINNFLSMGKIGKQNHPYALQANQPLIVEDIILFRSFQ